MKFVLSILLISLCHQEVHADNSTENVSGGEKPPPRLLALTIASHEKEGLTRMLRSAAVYGVDVKVLGLGIWNFNYWYCYKIVKLREFLEDYKTEEDLVVMMIDGYDIIFTAGEKELIQKFMKLDAKIVFGAEASCYPEIRMPNSFPENEDGYKCLNGGLVMGYAPYMYDLMARKLFKKKCDDQHFYSISFMIPEIREALQMKLDHKADIVQNLYKTPKEHYTLVFEAYDTKLVNVRYGTTPVLIHGNDIRTRPRFNMMGNYLAKAWTTSEGCTICKEGRIDLTNKPESEYPKVLVGVFVWKMTPFLQEMLRKVSALRYPKKQMGIYVYNSEPKQERVILPWLESHAKEYSYVKYAPTIGEEASGEARHAAIDACRSISCDLLFYVESGVHLENPETLNLLISYNRTMLAPVMSRKGKYLSTFWGSINLDTADYERSFDYTDIVDRVKKGIWNVPYICDVYVIWSSVFGEINFLHQYYRHHEEMEFVLNNFKKELFVYAVNYEDYGYLMTMEDGSRDLWGVDRHQNEWETKYLHPNYYQVLENSNFKKVCKDVYHFPLFSEDFIQDLSQELFHLRNMNLTEEWKQHCQHDVCMNQLKQIHYDEQWLSIMKKYVVPVVSSINKGCYGGEGISWMDAMARNESARHMTLSHIDLSNLVVRIALKDDEANHQCGWGNVLGTKARLIGRKAGWAIVYPEKLTREISVPNCAKCDLISFPILSNF